MFLLAILDFLFVSHAYHSILTRGASVQLVFGFEVPPRPPRPPFLLQGPASPQQDGQTDGQRRVPPRSTPSS